MPRVHVVFDLDDTLYPERDYAIGGFRSAAAWAETALGVSVDVAEMIRHLDDGHLGQLFPMVLGRAKPDHTPEDLKGFLRAYQGQSATLTLFDDAARILSHLSGKHRLGLITDGHHRTQAAKVTALGIGRRFDEIVYTGALGEGRTYHKPHPRAFEMMEAALGQVGDRFVYVGDNVSKDFVAPNARGWLSVLIDRPATRATRIHRQQVPAEGGKPQVQLDSLDGLTAVLLAAT